MIHYIIDKFEYDKKDYHIQEVFVYKQVFFFYIRKKLTLNKDYVIIDNNYIKLNKSYKNIDLFIVYSKIPKGVL